MAYCEVPDIIVLDNSKLPVRDDNDVTEIIDELIKQVEGQKLDVSCESCSFSTVEHRDQTLSFSFSTAKTNSPTERSRRHRSSNRKVRGRSKKRKWKPYSKMTWEERKRLEERDSRRAYRSREKMTASGLTLAPYNTTQFLMEDHNLQEPDYESIHHNKEDCHSYDSEEDFYFSPDDEEEFLNQQFSETYDSLHDDIINNMSKFELVRELMRLEDEIESVENSLKECRECIQKKILAEYPCLDVNAEMEKIQIFQDEIKKLSEENFILEKKNEALKDRVAQIKSG